MKPARFAMPPRSNDAFEPLRRSGSMRPWMSLVCRIWMCSPSRVAASVGAGAPAGKVKTCCGRYWHAPISRAARTSANALRRDRTVLQLVEAIVDTARVEQLAVRALLDDAALVQHDDAIDVLDRRQAVGDDDRGPAAHQLLQRVLDQVLRLGID